MFLVFNDNVSMPIRIMVRTKFREINATNRRLRLSTRVAQSL
jgi:hypothetical protein